MQSYNINPKTRGVNGYGVKPSDSVWRVKFDGTAVASVTVPGSLPMGAMGSLGSPTPNPSIPAAVVHNTYIAHFEYGTEVPGDVYVCDGTSATLPATNNFVQGPGELFPKAWEVKEGDIIYAACGTANQTMSVWFEHIQD